MGNGFMFLMKTLVEQIGKFKLKFGFRFFFDLYQCSVIQEKRR